MGFDAGSTLGDNLFICTNFSNECEGNITIGNPQTSTIENVLIEQNVLDIVTANYGSNTVSILLGDGLGSFDPANDLPVGSEPESVAVGDFNNDGNLDLAVANTDSNTVSILLGDGLGSFDPPNNFGVGGTYSFSVAVGDFNNDGNLDLVTSNVLSNNVSILLGNGDGTIFLNYTIHMFFYFEFLMAIHFYHFAIFAI